MDGEVNKTRRDITGITHLTSITGITSITGLKELKEHMKRSTQTDAQGWTRQTYEIDTTDA